MKGLCSRILVCIVCTILFVPPATVLFLREDATARSVHAAKEAKAQRDQEQRELDETLEKLEDQFRVPTEELIFGELGIVDEQTGVGLYVHRALMEGESLAVVQGLDCLHAQGSCEACDELRHMYDAGEIGELYCASLVPATSETDKIDIFFPPQGASGVTVYQCADGKLIETAPLRLRSYVYFETEYQTPFGVLRELPSTAADESEEIASGTGRVSSAKSYVHDYEPDEGAAHVANDEEAEDPAGDWASIVGILIAIGVVLLPYVLFAVRGDHGSGR